MSLIVIRVTSPRDRIRVTLRYDLPDPPEMDKVGEIAAHAIGVLTAQRLTAAVAVGYGPEALVTPVANELRDAGWQGRDRPARVPPSPGPAAIGPTRAATRPAAQLMERRSTPPPRIPPRARPWPRSASGCWSAAPPWLPASHRPGRHRRRVDAPGHPPRRAARRPATGQGPQVGPPRRRPAHDRRRGPGRRRRDDQPVPAAAAGSSRTTRSRGSPWRCGTCGSATTPGPGWIPRTEMPTSGFGSMWSCGPSPATWPRPPRFLPWRPGSQVMAQCKLGRPSMGAAARFRGVAAKFLHRPARVGRRRPVLPSRLISR
jgi:hypothetical protein